MLYAVICYNSEEMVFSWSKEEDDAVMARLHAVHDKWGDKIKPSLRLMPTTSAASLHKAKDMVIDGPFTETKEQLLGFYIIDVKDLEEAVQFARELSIANPGGGYEMRPVLFYQPGAPVEKSGVQ